MLRLVFQGLAFFVIVGGAHYYLWNRLVKRLRLPPRLQRWATGFFITMAVGLPLVVLASTFVSSYVGRTLGFPAFFWMGLCAILLVFLGATDLFTWLFRRARDRPVDPKRREFMARLVGGGAAITAVSGTGIGAIEALKTPGLVDVQIELSRLPASLDGFSILQLSDLHIGHTIGSSWVEDVVARSNSAGSDLIVITGDLVDGSVDSLRDAAAPLAELRAPEGVYFVTGNHDYYSGADSWIAYLREMGIRVLRNEHVPIANQRGGFDLAGIDDHSAHRFQGHGADVQRALAGRDTGRELVLLAHQPRQVQETSKYDVGLQLSGHTHGGQIWPWHYLASIQQKGLLAGLSRHGEHGATQLYVSRGTGYWGPPVRLGAPAEITRVFLRSPRRH